MKKLAVLAILFFASCGVQVPSVKVAPETATNLAALQALVAAHCKTSTPVWSIVEATSPNFSSPRDGAISQTGVFSAPICGSLYIGTTMHVQVECSNLNATAPIIVQEEVISTLAMYAAIVTSPAGTCLAPGSLTGVPAPVVPINGLVAWYAQVKLSCGDFVTPTPPASWPAVCP
jgi:hypothetical protein